MGPPGHPGPKGDMGPPGPSLPGTPVCPKSEKPFMTLFPVGITLKEFSLFNGRNHNKYFLCNFEIEICIVSALKYSLETMQGLHVLLVTVLLARKTYVNLS